MVPESPRVAGPRPDVAASVVLTVSVASLVWAISRAETLGRADRSVIGLLVLAAALGAVVVQRSRRHPRPLLPPSLFTRRTATAANLATVVFGIAFWRAVLLTAPPRAKCSVGAAVGVALVVTIQGTADLIAGFRAGWLFVAAWRGLAAAVSLAQPRPAPAPSPAAAPMAVAALDG